MFKVLLQYLILVCIFSAILLHMRTLSGEVWKIKEKTSTGLYMEVSQKPKKEKVSEGEQELEDKDTGMNDETHTGCNQECRCHPCMCYRKDKYLKTAAKQLSLHSGQDTSFNLCLIFVYHIVSRRTSIETILAVTTHVFWRASALPIKHSPQETRAIERRDSKHERRPRSASKRTQFFQGDCETNWIQRENQCYRLFREKMNYESAKQHCSSLGSMVVAVRTKDDNFFVYDMTKAGYSWISVYKMCKNCSGSGSYENWFPGQPDENTGCVVMVDDGRWKDFDCLYMFAFVCEKAVAKPTYSRETLLIALLVPIFSCLSVAITFTTTLLVSSVRRGNQPFKISSRYGRTKRQRKIATWEMLDTLRRASLKRRSSRPRPTIPNIEITEPDDENVKKVQTEKDKKVKIKEPWHKKKGSKRNAYLDASDGRRRSSGSSSNSSLYELLVRLNQMEFVQPKDNEGIQLQELPEQREETSIGSPTVEEKLETEEPSKRKEQAVEGSEEKRSFRNMAFRDSVVSIETSVNGVVTVTSLESGRIAPEKDPEDDSQNIDAQEEDSIRLNSNSLPSACDKQVCNRDGLGANKNTTTVKVDVHRISEDSSASNGNIENNHKNAKSIVWTYTI